jgi:hypothetical protein
LIYIHFIFNITVISGIVFPFGSYLPFQLCLVFKVIVTQNKREQFCFSGRREEEFRVGSEYN